MTAYPYQLFALPTAKPFFEGYEKIDMQDQLDCTPASRGRSKSLASTFIDLIAKAYKDWGGFDPDSLDVDNGGDGVGRDDGPEENELCSHELGPSCAVKERHGVGGGGPACTRDITDFLPFGG